MKANWLMAIFAVASLELRAAEFFVAPNGNDEQSGSRGQPFASFQRAQTAVKAERLAHADQAITVTFKAGTYLLSRPLEFTASDSGVSADRPVRYRAEPGGTVIISGERRITGWQPDPMRPGVWKTRVTESVKPDDFAWRFEQLWVNGERAVRARSPNAGNFGQLTAVSEKAASGKAPAWQHIYTVKPQALTGLAALDQAALEDVQIVAFHNWDTTRERLRSVNGAEGIFTTRGEAMQTWNPIKPENLYFLENYLEALDAPGEWFLARDGWLYYRPRPGEDLTTANAVSAGVDRFLSLAGKIEDSGQWVQHLRFEGLNFRFAEFRVPADGLRPGQAAMNVSQTAVQLDGVNDVEFRDCAVEHIGSTAFWFRQACRNCRVEHTRMFDLGISGVRIGEEALVPEAMRTSGITIDNCIIQSGGRIMPHAVAVWIGHSADNAITHDDIADFFYTGVSVGWRWGYDESGAKRNRIEFNRIHHLGYGILSDMGGVYTLGPSEGTVVRNNIVHDIQAAHYGGWGLYTDEGSTGILFENNLVYNVHDGCIHQHYGRENIFRNNILTYSDQGQIALTRAEPHLSFTFERNLVYWDEGKLLGYGGWGNDPKVAFHNNLYWRVGAWSVDFAGRDWKTWQAAGNDEGSVIADPLFVDPEHRDFHLRSGSPAKQIGFKPFDLAQPGVYGESRWKHLAESLTFPKAYVPPKP